MILRALSLVAMAALAAGCNPVVVGEMLAVMSANQHETDHFHLRNEVDDFYITADHHNYQAIEEYDWVNRGAVAAVEGAARPSCPNDVTIEIRDAEGASVFLNTFHAPHCWRDRPEHWDPMLTAAGTPGTWHITMTYDITGVKEMWFHIWRVGEVLVEGHVRERYDGEGHDPGHDDHGCQVVEWNAVSTADRDVEESYAFKCCGPTAYVGLGWTSIDEGSMEITIGDGYGGIVYHALLEAGTAPPPGGDTDPGHSGTWTVTLKATHLTCSGLSIYIEG